MEKKIQSNINLSKYSTFRIGGEAKFFVEIDNKEDLLKSFDWAFRNNQEVFFLGGGSNVLINDKGVNGLVLRLINSSIDFEDEKVVCGAGSNLIALSRVSASKSLTGLEWAIGIPGTIGGAVRGNAGAYDLSISDIVEEVVVFDVLDREFKTFKREDCCFSYRSSIFKENKNLLVWSIVLRLKKGNYSKIDEQINKNLISRNNSQPKLPSAGSVFKNLKFEDVLRDNIVVAEWAKKEGVVKNGMLASGWLLDKLGFKGKTMGGVKVSLEHANFIVNTGKGRAEEVVMLISYIKQQVRNRFKIQLFEEIQYFGF